MGATKNHNWYKFNSKVEERGTRPVTINETQQKAARERLLVHMGVQKHARAQHRAVGGQDLPPIGVVVPTGIGVADRDVNGERPFAAHANVHAHHVRLARERVPDRGTEPDRAHGGEAPEPACGGTTRLSRGPSAFFPGHRGQHR